MKIRHVYCKIIYIYIYIVKSLINKITFNNKKKINKTNKHDIRWPEIVGLLNFKFIPHPRRRFVLLSSRGDNIFQQLRDEFSFTLLHGYYSRRRAGKI